MQLGQEEVKVPLVVDNTIQYLKDLKNSTWNLLHLINTFSKVSEYENQQTKVIFSVYQEKNQMGAESHS